MKAIDVILTTIFRTCLQPYLKLATTCMTKDTLISYKELIVICEECGLVITNYNILITQLKSKLVAQPIITYITTRQRLTYSNYGKTSHTKKNLS